jgi:DNA-binding response OmpR family regulator
MRKEHCVAKRILAIDDNEDLLTLLRDVFGEEGFDYLGCSRPREAYQLARQNQPDLVLLDIMMPSMNGWEVLNLFVLDRTLRRIPTVLMTAAVADAERRLAKLGLADVSILGKPFDVDRLLAHVNDALGNLFLCEEGQERLTSSTGGPVLLRDEP